MIHVINLEEYQYSSKCYKIVFPPFSEDFYVFEYDPNGALDALADWFKKKDTMHGLWSQTDESTDWEDESLMVFGNNSDVILEDYIIREAHPIIFLKFSIGDTPDVYEQIVKKF